MNFYFRVAVVVFVYGGDLGHCIGLGKDVSRGWMGRSFHDVPFV